MLAFMAAQGDADYTNRRDMQPRGIKTGKAKGIYKGRSKTLDPVAVKAWRAEHGRSIAQTAKEFEISTATVKRYLKEA